MASYSDTMTFYAGLLPFESDYYAPKLPTFYRDIMRFVAGGKASMSAAYAAADSLRHLAGGKLAITDTQSLHDVTTFKVAGRLNMAAVAAAVDTETSYAGVAPSMANAEQAHDVLTMPGGAQLTAPVQTVTADRMIHAAGAKAILPGIAVQADTLQAGGGAKLVPAGSTAAQDTLTHQVGFALVMTPIANHRDTMTTQGGADHTLTSAQRQSNDSFTFSAGAHLTKLTGSVSSDQITFVAGATLRMIDNNLTTFADFVAACRARVIATLPEISRVPESLPEVQALAPGQLPFIMMNVGDDSDISGNYAVQSEAQQVQVDFVYLAKTPSDGSTDEIQVLRNRLDVLAAAFFADRRLGGLANRTEQAHAPLLSDNQYRQHFANLQIGAVTIMILSLQFDLVESMVQYAM